MAWLDNFKIFAKISLMIVLVGVVAAGCIGFSTMQMSSLAASYRDLVERVDNATTIAARAGRNGMEYLATAFQLASETTNEGNVKFLAKVAQDRDTYLERMSAVAKELPERHDEIERVVATFQRAFAVCDPIIKFAATTTTSEGSLEAANRLKAECVKLIEPALEDHTRMVNKMQEFAAKSASDLQQQAHGSIVLVIVSAALGLVAGLVVALWTSIKGLSQPIGRLKSVMAAFASNDLSQEVPGVHRRDELGDMARTVEVFKTNALEVQRMRAEQDQKDHLAAERRKADMNQLAGAFEAAVGEIIETVSSASTELEAAAATLTQTADGTQRLATDVTSASEEASGNVQSVASATEEMASSVSEIGRQIDSSARIARDAVRQAEQTDERINKLNLAAGKIGDIVSLITSIAGQTNLLALNATIEAARAGDAGRGFAVVASEVKALAAQTAKATSEISEQIAEIQTATQESVVAIKEVGTTINQISQITGTIAAAVEEQDAATKEIARSVAQAAGRTSDVASNITEVNRGAQETGSASAQVLSSAQSLSAESNRLKLEVGKFLATVRAA